LVGMAAPQPEITPYPSGQWSMTVCAMGAVQGSIVRVERSLRDGTTGDLLGRRSDDGPFVGYTKMGVVDPLRDSGSQRLDFSFDSGPNRLGFSGNRSYLLTEVVIKETTGLDRTVSGQFEVNRFPVPVLRAPVGVVVRQNDPRSGCPFDPVNGYGVAVADGAGRRSSGRSTRTRRRRRCGSCAAISTCRKALSAAHEWPSARAVRRTEQSAAGPWRDSIFNRAATPASPPAVEPAVNRRNRVP
jgi:hypothetical protein